VTNKAKGEIIISNTYLYWNRKMYYMAIKYIGAYNEKANFYINMIFIPGNY
jgi:hypothetical protein